MKKAEFVKLQKEWEKERKAESGERRSEKGRRGIRQEVEKTITSHALFGSNSGPYRVVCKYLCLRL